MKKLLTGLATVVALGLSAPAFAQEAGHEEIVAACLAGSNLPEPVCTCMADKLTSDEFTDAQRTWYVLSQTDQDAAEAVVGDMPVTDTTQIAMFSASGPGQCAAGGEPLAAEAGYSGTPLPKKLGLADGQRVLFLGLPEEQAELAETREFVEARTLDWAGLAGAGSDWDVIHGFTTARAVIEDNKQALMDAIARNGMVWISWPKKASKVPTDVTEDTLREIFLPIGLVDVKVCAIDNVWSGLKLVIRKELR